MSTDQRPGRPGRSTAGSDETPTARGRVRTRTVLLVGVLLSLVLAGVVSAYASSHPDGLQSVAADLGFLGTARDSAGAASPFADYATRGVGDARLSGGLAGLVGVLVVGALAFVLFRVLARRSRR
jgi:cobalt/nickel transport protein